MLVALAAQGGGQGALEGGTGPAHVQVRVCVLVCGCCFSVKWMLQGQKQTWAKQYYTWHASTTAKLIASLTTHGGCCRAHWVHLELVFCGWRKAAAAGKLLLTQQGSDCETAAAVVANQSDQQPHESPDSSLEAAAGSATAAAQAEASTVSGLLPDEPPAASCDGCVDGSSADASSCGDSSSSSQYAEPACLVHVSLADYPVGQAWRGLQQRRAVLAPQGLRRLTGLRLGRAARDLSELEGAFMVKDSDRCGVCVGGGGVLWLAYECACVYICSLQRSWPLAIV